MAVTKYLNPKYSEGGAEPKYLSVPSLVAGGGEEPDLSNYLAKDNTTEYTPTSEYHPATKKYVDDSISTQATNIISQITDSAPETLDTLNELAAALGDDPNFATTITSQIAGKANSVHTHVITDVTGLVNNGDGTKFLADDGKYKNISEKYSSRTFVLFSSDFAGSSYVLKPIEAPSDWSEQMVITSENSNASGFLLASDVSEDGSKYAVRFTYSGTTYPAQGSWKLQNNVTGDIMQILAVVIQSQKVLSESEYSALGTTPETDNVLYFVTPD